MIWDCSTQADLSVRQININRLGLLGHTMQLCQLDLVVGVPAHPGGEMKRGLGLEPGHVVVHGLQLVGGEHQQLETRHLLSAVLQEDWECIASRCREGELDL